MKIQISNSTSRIVDRPRKCIKLLSHLKKEAGNDEFEAVSEELNQSFGSDSSIQILNGSFSMVRPIGSKRIAMPSCEAQHPRSSTQKSVGNTSTPRYEDISDIESSGDDSDREDVQDEQEALNSTFNYQLDVLQENQVSDRYMQQVAEFVQNTEQMVAAKSKKRVELLKKLRKYQRKMKNVQRAVSQIDKIIEFGNQLPTFINNLRKE